MGSCKTCGGFKSTSKVALPLPEEPSICPAPTCDCENFCEEDHVNTTVYTRYGYALRIKTAFVWPAVDETVSLQVQNIESLAIGTILWNATAGYLHVVSFDFASQIVVADNEGENCNTYTGGEELPACTEFGVGLPSCDPGSDPDSNIPYLAADFTAPANGDCALASVTTIVGLTINDTISLSGYSYSIGDIINSETIELCNDGDGAPTGTVIEWDADSDGIPNIPIIVISEENPCTRDPIVAGVILACDGSDTAKPLTGSVTGQIPVWNAITERFELKNITAPYTVCTALLADLTLDPVHVGSYIISVITTVDMLAGMSLVIDNQLFTIDSVDDATTIHATPVITPTIIQIYQVGFPVCIYVESSFSDTDNAFTATVGPSHVYDALTGTAVISITNPSPFKPMNALVGFFGFYSFLIDAAYAAGTKIAYDLEYSFNGGPFTSVLPFPFNDDAYLPSKVYTRELSNILPVKIPPGTTVTYGVRAGVMASVLTPATFNGGSFQAQVVHLSVAV